MRPLIGITPSVNHQEGLGELFSIHSGYAEAIIAAGGIPVALLPHGAGVAELIAATDGIIFSGGYDIRPSRTVRRSSTQQPTASATCAMSSSWHC